MAFNWIDVLKFNDLDGARDIASEIKVNCPEFTGRDVYGGEKAVAQTTTDRDYVEGFRRIEQSFVSPFRNLNEGFPTSKGVYEKCRFELTNVGQYVQYDRAAIDRDKNRGAKILENEAKRVVEDVTRALGRQFFYGGTSDGGASAKGFQGLQYFVDPDLTLDGGGNSGSGTHKLTSVYFVRWNEFDGATWIFGRDGYFGLSEIEKTTKVDPNDSTALIPIYQQLLEYYPGFGYFSKYAAARIANVDVASADTPASLSTTALTDKLILAALEKFDGETPDAIYMTRAAGLLLAASRQPSITISGTTVTTGFMDVPKEVAGIPILYTNSLTNSETAVSFS